MEQLKEQENTGQGGEKVKEETVLMELDVQMDAGILYDYMLYHTYHGVAGMLGTIVGFFMIVYYISCQAGILYLIFGIVVTAYLPVSLYLSAKRQALMNPVFKKSLHYTFTDAGIEVSQEEAEDSLEWQHMRKAVSTTKSIILYTSKVNATIIPRRACDGRVMDLIGIIATHMDPEKVKIRQ